MANWTLPSLSDLYDNVLTYLKDRDLDIAKGLDPAVVTVTNPVANFIRWNSANAYWEKYNGTAWAALTTTYAINAATSAKWAAARTITLGTDLTGNVAMDGSTNVTLNATLATVNANVGAFGSASAVPVITVDGKGRITAVSTAALGSIATQAANNVSITGGAISATAITLVQSTTAAPTAEGRMEWDTDGDELKIGTGAATKTVVNTDNTQTLTNKTMSTGCSWGGNAIPVANGGTGASDAATARSNLGVGTLGAQHANNVTITGGAISGTAITLVGSISAAPTAEGRMEWDTDNDLLVVGTGTATKVMCDTDGVQTISNKVFSGCTWNGTAVGANYGGTGQTTYAVGDLLYASGTTTLSKLADVATGNALISGGVNVAPAWGKIGLTTHISGTLAVGNGGTGLTTYTAGGIVYASNASTLASLGAGTAGQFLKSGGAGAAPVWTTESFAALAGSFSQAFAVAAPVSTVSAIRGDVCVMQQPTIYQTFSTGALTLALQPCVIKIGSSSIVVTTAISVTVPSGATLGTISGAQSDIAILALDNAGTVELAVINVACGTTIKDSGYITTTAIDANADSATTAYSAAARNTQYRVVGVFTSTQATAGTWATSGDIFPAGTAGMLDKLLEPPLLPSISLSGTSVDITGLPAGLNRFTVMLSAASTSGTSNPQVQLGDAGGIENTGYRCQSAAFVTSSAFSSADSTSGVVLSSATATNSIDAALHFTRHSGNTWECVASYKNNSTAFGLTMASKTLSATLDRVRITTVNGTDTFDAGTVSILLN